MPKVQNGWVFFGRAGLPTWAVVWNSVPVLAVLGLGGAMWWGVHTSSPEYRYARGTEAAEAKFGSADYGGAAKDYWQIKSNFRDLAASVTSLAIGGSARAPDKLRLSWRSSR